MQGIQPGGMGVPTPPGTMSPYVPPAGANIITTELIQKYLDENKQLILAILDNQNLGKLNECAQYQSRLQQNLMYLAAIADAQPQLPSTAQPAAASPAIQPQQYPQQQPPVPQQPMMQQTPQQPMQQMGQPQAMMTPQQQQPVQYAPPQQFQQQPPAMVPQQQPQPGMDSIGGATMVADPNGAPGYATHQVAATDAGVPPDGAPVHSEAQHFEMQQQLQPQAQEQPHALGAETGVHAATVEGDQTHAT